LLKELSYQTGVVAINYAEGPSNGPPLVLLHGLTGRWQAFLSVIPALSVRWHIYALDFRGHGKSGRVPRQYQLQDYVEDVKAFVQRQLTEPAVLFGHSLGGVIAMLVTAILPEAVRALVLADSIIFRDSLRQLMRESIYPCLFSAARDLARSGEPVEKLVAALEALHISLPRQSVTMQFKDLPGNDATFQRWYAKCLTQLDPDTLTPLLEGYSVGGYDPDAMLQMICCPTLLLQADPGLGAMMSDKDVSRALSLLARATHMRFDGLGHQLHMQQSEPVMRSVMNFLESL
jgi:pimeloyl-ACP methyl ester carboxylesterase